jgi:tetratricopeptide (TPR) repeat protein
MSLNTLPISTAWSRQQQQWSTVYAAQLPAQLERVTAVVHQMREEPAALAAHFDSCLTLLDRASAPDLAPLWLDLVAALHPLPLRWRRWEEWGQVLNQAAARCATVGDTAQQATYLAAAAELQRQYGNLEQALTIAEQALELARQAHAILPLAQAGSTAVAALRFLGQSGRAVVLLDEVQRLLNEPTPRANSATLAQPQILLDLQRMDLLRSTGDLPAAVTLAERLAVPLEQDPAVDAHFLATVLRRRATILWAAARYAESAADLERSATLFDQAGDPLQAVFSRGNLGLVYYSMARYDQAETRMREVIAAAEEMNAQWRLMRDIGNLAAVYFARGQLEIALTYAQRHLDLALRFGDGAEQSRGAGNHTCIRVYLGQVAATLPELQAVYDRLFAQERPEGYLSALVDLAVAFHLLGDQERSHEHARRIFAHPAAQEFPSLHILGLRARALTEDDTTAVSTLRQALDLARRHGRALDEAGCLLSLAGLTGTPAEQAQLWQEGSKLLTEIGAKAWLVGRTPADPPLVALIL